MNTTRYKNIEIQSLISRSNSRSILSFPTFLNFYQFKDIEPCCDSLFYRLTEKNKRISGLIHKLAKKYASIILSDDNFKKYYFENRLHQNIQNIQEFIFITN